MKKYIFTGVLLFTFAFSPVVTSAAALSEQQIQAILNLLGAFGGDTTTITNVESALRGTGSASTPTPTTSSRATSPRLSNTTGTNSTTASGSSTGVTTSCIQLSRSLYLDATDAQTGGEVTKLQRFLAQDPSIYPEGLVTGYFGPATERAVQRWQARNGVVSTGTSETTGYGSVGPNTRRVLARGCVAQSTSSTTQAPGTSGQTTSQTTTAGERPHITNVQGKAALDFEVDAGSSARVEGTNLGNKIDSVAVYVGGYKIRPTFHTDNYLDVLIPASLRVGRTYSLYIQNEFGTSNSVTITVLSRVSDTSITNSDSITLLSPNGGERWRVGETHLIQWSFFSTGKDGRVGLELIDTRYPGDYGTSIVPLVATTIPNTGQYYWTIPNNFNSLNNYEFNITGGKVYKIRVARTLDSGVTIEDYSNSVFSIEPAITDSTSGSTSNPDGTTTTTTTVAPSITITPNRASIGYGDTINFTWNVTPTSGTVCYAINGGLGTLASTSAIPLSGSWTTPALTETKTYGIKCTNQAGTVSSYATVSVAAQTTTSTNTQAPAPTISAFSPGSVKAGQQVTITIVGRNFTSESKIRARNSITGVIDTLAPTFIDSTRLNVTGVFPKANTYLFWVANSDGQTSSSSNFYVFQ